MDSPQLASPPAEQTPGHEVSAAGANEGGAGGAVTIDAAVGGAAGLPAAGSGGASSPMSDAGHASVVNTGGAPSSNLPTGIAGMPASMMMMLLGSGQVCTLANTCASGRCVDGHCCEAASCGECQRCGMLGQCEPVLDAIDADSCTGKKRCSAKGRCVLPLGEKCTTADECDSGACVDGVCCGKSACGKCQACNNLSSPGTCTAIVGGDDADSCSGASTCSHAGECLLVDQQVLTHEAPGQFGNYRHVNERVAQTFTVGRSGTLVEVRMAAYCPEVGQLNMELRSLTTNQAGDGQQPSGSVLGRLQVIEVGDHSKEHSDGMQSFPLVSPLNVSAGQKLGIVLSAPGATMECYGWVSGGTDVYPGGSSYWVSTDNTPQFGDEFYMEMGDMAFKTLVR